MTTFRIRMVLTTGLLGMAVALSPTGDSEAAERGARRASIAQAHGDAPAARARNFKGDREALRERLQARGKGNGDRAALREKLKARDIDAGSRAELRQKLEERGIDTSDRAALREKLKARGIDAGSRAELRQKLEERGFDTSDRAALRAQLRNREAEGAAVAEETNQTPKTRRAQWRERMKQAGPASRIGQGDTEHGRYKTENGTGQYVQRQQQAGGFSRTGTRWESDTGGGVHHSATRKTEDGRVTVKGWNGENGNKGVKKTVVSRDAEAGTMTHDVTRKSANGRSYEGTRTYSRNDDGSVAMSGNYDGQNGGSLAVDRTFTKNADGSGWSSTGTAVTGSGRTGTTTGTYSTDGNRSDRSRTLTSDSGKSWERDVTDYRGEHAKGRKVTITNPEGEEEEWLFGAIDR